ncbi:MAG TPA: proton-conducting transporter membrane subunit [Planctomycetaceae bacterium]|nr:proton-conducting transporter membrane subunit [Planctomycetaceae bacterium]
MNELHFPWIELAIFLPLLGAAWVMRLRDPARAHSQSLVVTASVFIASILEAQDFYSLHIFRAEDRWHLMSRLIGRELFAIDELNAPLIPLIALLFLLTNLATGRTKAARFSFSTMLLTESLTLGLFSAVDPWVIIILMALGTMPAYFELKARGQPTRLYGLAMAASSVLLALGWLLVQRRGPASSLVLFTPLLIGVAIRCGLFPFQSWVINLYDKASFGSALLLTTPLAGAYAALRLIVPMAPDSALRILGLVSLFTAIYSAALALVQTEARRFMSRMVISHSAMVLVGLEVATPLGLTGALCVWLSAGLSLGGFGLTLRALEARRGRLPLVHFQGLYEHTPALAVCFLLTGLACVGFPGTVGFVGTEMLIDGAVEAYPHVGPWIVIASALNGIAIMRAYFLLFTGTQYSSSISLRIGGRERIAVLTLAVLVLGGGLVPQPGVATAYHAAQSLLKARERTVSARENPPEQLRVHAEPPQ